MQESRKDKVLKAKVCVWMGFLLAEQGALNLRDNTSGKMRYEANATLKYIQNKLKQLNARNPAKVKAIDEAEDSLLINTHLMVENAEILAMLPPELADDYHDEYLKWFDNFIKQKTKEYEQSTAS